MIKIISALILAVAVLAATANAATYVEYQLYNASDCNANSLVQTGIYSGENECIPSPNGGSRVFTCSGSTVYPGTGCKSVEGSTVQPTVETLDLCRPANTGTTTEFIKYACRSGGWARVSSSTAATCTQLQSAATSTYNDNFYLANKCNPGFQALIGPALLNSPTQGSAAMIQINATDFAVLEWDSRVGCSGTPDRMLNYSVGCTVEVNLFTEATTSSVIKLFSAASVMQVSMAALSALVVALTVVTI